MKTIVSVSLLMKAISATATSKIAGRYTISPDNVAFKAINNGPLKLVVFYHDGKRIDENKEKLMEALMQVK